MFHSHNSRIFLVCVLVMLLFVPSASIEGQGGSTEGAWVEIPDSVTSGNPDGRHETAFVAAGGRFFLIAGRESNTIDIYDPQTQAWTTGARHPVHPEALHHFQPMVVDGLIFAVNAYTGNCCGSNERGATNVYIYDPVEDMWITGRDIPETRRRGSTGVVQYGDTLYSMGGLDGGHGSSTSVSFDYFDAYNPYTGTWETLPDMPHNRDHFGAAIIDDKIYAAGGRDTGQGNGTQGDVQPQVDVYDLMTGTWSTLDDDIPTERGGTATAVLGNDVIIIGGEEISQSSAFSTVEALDVTTEQWRALASLNTERHGTTAAVCNGTIWIAGGSPNRGGGNMINIERYHPISPTDCNQPEITPSSLSTAADYLGAADEVGQSVTATVTVSNTGGNQATYIKSLRLENDSLGEFDISNGAASDIIVAPDGEIEIEIMYTPQDEGQDSVDLVIETPQRDTDFLVTLTANVPGSIDRDGNQLITPTDVVYVINRIGTSDLSADVDRNGLVTVEDVTPVLGELGNTFP